MIVIQALVLSELDYCNSLLTGSPEYQLDKLQHIQNMACRIICNIWKHDHITLHLAYLIGLKIFNRITYKIDMIMFKCNQGTAPWYLMDLMPKKMYIKTSKILNIKGSGSCLLPVIPWVYVSLLRSLTKNMECFIHNHKVLQDWWMNLKHDWRHISTKNAYG